jgi:secretion-regulating guanine nucleotide exchange factor
MLLCWGANSYGQLGLGHTSEQEILPQQLSEPPSGQLVKVVGGGGHTLAVDRAGNLFVCGWNRFGQLGLNPRNGDENVTRFTRVTGLTDVAAVAAGWDFSLVLLQDGRVLGAGSNRYGQIGKGGPHLGFRCVAYSTAEAEIIIVVHVDKNSAKSQLNINKASAQ